MSVRWWMQGKNSRTSGFKNRKRRENTRHLCAGQKPGFCLHRRVACRFQSGLRRWWLGPEYSLIIPATRIAGRSSTGRLKRPPMQAPVLGVMGRKIKFLTRSINLGKSGNYKARVEIFGAPLEFTWSCYLGGRKPCGHCDSCKLRAKDSPAPGC